MPGIRSDFRLRRNVSGRIREYPLSWAGMAATLIVRATDVEVQSTALAVPGWRCRAPARPRACHRLRSLSHTRRVDQAWRDGGAVAQGCLRVRTRGSSDVPHEATGAARRLAEKCLTARGYTRRQGTMGSLLRPKYRSTGGRLSAGLGDRPAARPCTIPLERAASGHDVIC